MERFAIGRGKHQAAALTAAIDAMTDGVCIGDSHGIRRSNGAMLQLLGVAAPESLQIRLDELVRRFRLRHARDGPLLTPDELPFTRALDGQATPAEM